MKKKVKVVKNKKLNIRQWHNSTKGITLITLVITIILLIILAGVAINLSLGENGIFKRAKEAKNLYINAQKAEEENINEISDKLVNMEFRNTGKDENPPEETVKPGESGYEGGKYNDPYIPKGFKYTEGTWNTGYTIIGETSSIGNEFVWVPCVLTEQERQQAQNSGDIVQIFKKTMLSTKILLFSINFNSKNLFISLSRIHFSFQ